MKLYTLKELLQIKNGKDHKDLPNGNFPVFGSGGLMRHVDRSLYNKESILLPRKGTLSNIQYVKEPFWTVDTLYYSIVDESKANTFYLYNYLKTLDLSRLNTGTGVPSMTFDLYYDLEIKLPDLTTQRQIASVLSSLDSKIELNNRINSELEGMAKLLYDYWFVQFDFPTPSPSGRAGVGLPYKSSGGKMVWNVELKREVPEGWEVKKISSLANFVNGKGISKEQFDVNGKYCVLGSNGIVGKTNQILFSDPVIAIGRVGANYGEVHYSLDPCWISDNAVTAQPLKGYYLWWLIDTLERINYKKIAGGSAQPLITQGQLKELKFAIPYDNLFIQYHEKVNAIYLQINLNIKQNEELSSLRDWLLPMLMNGQVKVK